MHTHTRPVSETDAPAPVVLDGDLIPLAAELTAIMENRVAREEEALEAQEEPAPLPLVELRRQATLLGRIVTAMSSRVEQLDAFEEQVGGCIHEWLESLPFDLAEAGQPDEGIALARRLQNDLLGEGYAPTLARLLASQDQTAEALRIIDDLLAQAPEDPILLDAAADIYPLCGRDERAEEIDRSLLESEELEDLPEVFFAAGSRLVDRLRARGDDDEADDIEHMLEEFALTFEDEEEEEG